MQTIRLTLNRGSPAKRVVKNGRTYLVAPVTMLIGDRVLEGSKGRLFYPAGEVAREPGVWNNTPITVGHPTNWYGQALSASDPLVRKQYRIGDVRNDRYVRGRRVAEGWFDEALTKRKAPEVYDALIAGDAMEVSTGLFTDDDPTPGVAPDGRVYDVVARGPYRPDHLAVLPNQRGACSLEDGCGLFPTTNCRRSRPMNRRTNDMLLPETPQDLAANCSPSLRGMTRRNGRWVDPADEEASGGRQSRADDLTMDVPSIDWSEIASPAINKR